MSDTGPGALTYTRAKDDPCGYVTDNPSRVMEMVNQMVAESLQRTTTKVENNPENARQAWRIHNLMREMAERAGKATEDGTRQLMFARMRKVLENAY